MILSGKDAEKFNEQHENGNLSNTEKERILKNYFLFKNEYDNLKEERDLLIEALGNMVNSYEKSRGLLMITYLHPEYSKAKELLNKLK